MRYEEYLSCYWEASLAFVAVCRLFSRARIPLGYGGGHCTGVGFFFSSFSSMALRRLFFLGREVAALAGRCTSTKQDTSFLDKAGWAVGGNSPRDSIFLFFWKTTERATFHSPCNSREDKACTQEALKVSAPRLGGRGRANRYGAAHSKRAEEGLLGSSLDCMCKRVRETWAGARSTKG